MVQRTINTLECNIKTKKIHVITTNLYSVKVVLFKNKESPVAHVKALN